MLLINNKSTNTYNFKVKDYGQGLQSHSHYKIPIVQGKKNTNGAITNKLRNYIDSQDYGFSKVSIDFIKEMALDDMKEASYDKHEYEDLQTIINMKIKEDITYYNNLTQEDIDNLEIELAKQQYITEYIEGKELEPTIEEKLVHKKNKNQKDTRKRRLDKAHDILLSNQWDYFVTLTFDKEMVDRTNYNEVSTKLTTWLNNVRKRKCPDLKYFAVVELHKDRKAYHFHAVFANCDGLDIIPALDKCGNPMYEKKTKRQIFNISDYYLGFSSATKVESSQKTSNYLIKYIIKGYDYDSKLDGKNAYRNSTNVDLPKVDKFLTPDTNEVKEKLQDKLIKEVNKQFTFPDGRVQKIGICLYNEITESIEPKKDSEYKHITDYSEDYEQSFVNADEEFTEDMLDLMHPIYDNLNDSQIKIVNLKVKRALMQNRTTEKELLTIEERYKLRFGDTN